MARPKKNLIIKVKKIDEKAVIPTYAHNGDVGMDFTAISVEYDKEKDLYIYHTGLAFESDFNYGQFLFPRSSNRKTDAYLTNSVGIADSAIYRGEIMFCYKNRDSYKTKGAVTALKNAMINAHDFDGFKNLFSTYYGDILSKQDEWALKDAPYQVGDRIGQMVILGYQTVEIQEVEELSDSSRGTNGFGSTGK